MKQLFAILTVVVLLSACGNSNTEKCENCADSTAVVADSATTVDTTAVAVDTTATK